MNSPTPKRQRTEQQARQEIKQQTSNRGIKLMCMRPTGGIYVILITFIVCDVWSMMWLCVLVCRDIHV